MSNFFPVSGMKILSVTDSKKLTVIIFQLEK